MEKQCAEQVVMDDDSASLADGDGRFCPECGQSLNLDRHQKAPVKRRRLEPFVFLIFGLCLTVGFGLRAMHSATQLSRLDQQIVALRAQAANGIHPAPGNPTMIVADMLDELQTEQLGLQIGFDRDITGLGLGLLTVIVGGVSWLNERPGLVDRRRKRTRLKGMPPSNRRQVNGLWNLGGPVATSLVRMILLLFVIVVGLQVIRGTPPSLQLVDQALTRVITIVLTVGASLS